MAQHSLIEKEIKVDDSTYQIEIKPIKVEQGKDNIERLTNAIGKFIERNYKKQVSQKREKVAVH